MVKRTKTVTRKSADEILSAETRREKFERIGRRRMNNVLVSIRLLGNLSTNQYEWSDADVERMKRVIGEFLAMTFSRFRKGKTAFRPDFEFPTGEKNPSEKVNNDEDVNF